MDARPDMFPHLTHFLDAYLHQDWDVDGETLEQVISAYVINSTPSDIVAFEHEIQQFLENDIEQTEVVYSSVYPNGVIPSAWDMTTAQWLRHIVALALERSPSARLKF